MSILKIKKDLRCELLKRRRGLSVSEQETAGRSVAQKLFSKNLIEPHQALGLYWPSEGEIPTERICRQVLASGGRLFLPRISGVHLLFSEVKDLSTLKKNSWGILEPLPDAPETPLERLHALLIPGVAFDEEGSRLGRGKGYYDRILSVFRGTKIALAYEFQIIAHVPVEPFDQPVEMIVTENRAIHCVPKA